MVRRGSGKIINIASQNGVVGYHDRAAYCSSKAGVVNKDYLAQKNFLAKLDKGDVQLPDAKAKAKELFATELAAVK